MQRRDAPKPIRLPREVVDWLRNPSNKAGVTLETLPAGHGWRLTSPDRSEEITVAVLPRRGPRRLIRSE